MGFEHVADRSTQSASRAAADSSGRSSARRFLSATGGRRAGHAKPPVHAAFLSAATTAHDTRGHRGGGPRWRIPASDDEPAGTMTARTGMSSGVLAGAAWLVLYLVLCAAPLAIALGAVLFALARST